LDAGHRLSCILSELGPLNPVLLDNVSHSACAVIESCRLVLEKTPPELVADIIDRGVALCGGGALLRGIDKLITKSLGIPAYQVDNPLTSVVEGAARGLGMLGILKRNLPEV